MGLIATESRNSLKLWDIAASFRAIVFFIIGPYLKQASLNPSCLKVTQYTITESQLRKIKRATKKRGKTYPAKSGGQR